MTTRSGGRAARSARRWRFCSDRGVARSELWAMADLYIVARRPRPKGTGRPQSTRNRAARAYRDSPRGWAGIAHEPNAGSRPASEHRRTDGPASRPGPPVNSPRRAVPAGHRLPVLGAFLPFKRSKERRRSDAWPAPRSRCGGLDGRYLQRQARQLRRALSEVPRSGDHAGDRLGVGHRIVATYNVIRYTLCE